MSNNNESGVLRCKICSNDVLSSLGHELESVCSSSPLVFDTKEGEEYGVQQFTCQKCTNHFCYTCVDNDTNHEVLDTCSNCEGMYCSGCSAIRHCDGVDCIERHCAGCEAFIMCNHCGDKFCCKCIRTKVCQYCGMNCWCNECEVHHNCAFLVNSRRSVIACASVILLAILVSLAS